MEEENQVTTERQQVTTKNLKEKKRVRGWLRTVVEREKRRKHRAN